MSRDFRLFLDDIRTACGRIEEFTTGMDATAFAADPKTISAVERQLFIIGEAVKQLPPDVRSRFAEVEWREVSGFRDVLAHGSWKIDPETLWTTARQDVPMLLGQIERILEVVGALGT